MTGLRFSLEDLLAVAIIILIAVVISYGIAFMFKVASVEAQCYQHGWADYKVAWNFNSYCLREENEYEIIRPLADILEEAVQ